MAVSASAACAAKPKQADEMAMTSGLLDFFMN
jgi:hypothetical protein